MSSAASSSPSDELLNLLVRELGGASDTCLADRDVQKGQHDDARQHAAAERHGIVKSEPPSSDDLDLGQNVGTASAANNRHERCTSLVPADPAVDEPICIRIGHLTESVTRMQLPAPTVGVPPGTTTADRGQLEPSNPQVSLVGPANGRRRGRPTVRPVKAQCELCGQCFVKVAHYTKHRTIHTGEKPHECSVCGRRFRQPVSLKMHMMSHTGERPFVCELCGQGYRAACHLTRHKLVHTGERPHACKMCPNRYYDAWALHNHERSHTGERPFACTHCGLRFVRRTHAKRHELTHLAQDKPYGCGVCGKRVSSSIALKKHTQRIHTAEPRNVIYCDECGGSFSSLGSLKVHTARIHGTNSGARN